MSLCEKGRSGKKKKNIKHFQNLVILYYYLQKYDGKKKVLTVVKTKQKEFFNSFQTRIAY